VTLIGDCDLLCVLSIGGPAAARVVNSGIHPIKRRSG
jgi:nitrogen fixation protein NifX